MFERNRIDNAADQQAVPVEVALLNGDVLKGRVMIAMGRSLGDLLNGTSAFIDFEAYGGDRVFLAKATLASVKPVNVPRAPQLSSKLQDHDGFDPHAILGLERGAPRDAAKAAWHRLAKLYHPDRYSGIELPKDMADYIAAMSRRINAAYAALDEPHQAMRRSQDRAQPVYQSAGRA